MVEGGARIIQSVLEKELVDQVVVTIRPCYLGGYRAMSHELIQPVSLVETAAASVGGDIIIYGKVQKQQQQQQCECELPTSSLTDKCESYSVSQLGTTKPSSSLSPSESHINSSNSNSSPEEVATTSSGTRTSDIKCINNSRHNVKLIGGAYY